MNLADVLGAPDRSRPMRTGKVTAHPAGASVTVELGGGTVPARWLTPKPAIGATVLVVYVADEPVCLGVFGT